MAKAHKGEKPPTTSEVPKLNQAREENKSMDLVSKFGFAAKSVPSQFDNRSTTGTSIAGGNYMNLP